jgi:hypothetical protein
MPALTTPATAWRRYTLSQLMLQDAFYVATLSTMGYDYESHHTLKLDGVKIWSAQVPGQPDVAYELPAQSPGTYRLT